MVPSPRRSVHHKIMQGPSWANSCCMYSYIYRTNSQPAQADRPSAPALSVSLWLQWWNPPLKLSHMITRGIFGTLYLYSTNINENTQGSPGLPWVIAEFWRISSKTLGSPNKASYTQGIPWVFEAFYVFKYTNINFEYTAMFTFQYWQIMHEKYPRFWILR